jgi:ribosomal protein S18 acetylase RimI-like enzyme
MNQIRRLEEISMNAWPSIYTTVYDGWLLRYSYGLTKRANCIIPIYGTKINTEEKITFCEQFYKNRNIDVIFKMSSEVFPHNLDSILESKGYDSIDETSVQTLKLIKTKENNKQINWDINENVNKWISKFSTLVPRNSDQSPTLKMILSRIITPRYLLSTTIKDETVACGLGVLEGDYLGLFSIIVNEKYRNRGYATAIVNKLLDLGMNDGAKEIYLQVMSKNKPAMKLYSKMGFKQIYKYWYRIKQF